MQIFHMSQVNMLVFGVPQAESQPARWKKMSWHWQPSEHWKAGRAPQSSHQPQSRHAGLRHQMYQMSPVVTSLGEKKTYFRLFQINAKHLDRLVGHQLLHLLALRKSLHQRKNRGRENHRGWWLTNSTTSSLIASSLHHFIASSLPLYLCYPRLHRHALTLHDNVEAISRIALPWFVGPKTALTASFYGFARTRRQKTLKQSATLTEAACLMTSVPSSSTSTTCTPWPRPSTVRPKQVQDGILELGIGHFSMNEGANHFFIIPFKHL